MAFKIHSEKKIKEKKKLEKQLKEIFDGEIEIIPKDYDENMKSKQGFTIRIKGMTDKMNEAFSFGVKSNDQRNLLYINSLISLVSSAEWFYSQLLHYFYDKYPGAASIRKKTLTLDELKSFGTVEDAEKYLIDAKIEDILRGSLTHWFTTLRDELKLKLGYVKQYEHELEEIYQRRNLFVHNGGIVNSIYISKISQAKKENLKIGDKLVVSENYLDDALRKFHVIFSLIAIELWKQLEPKNTDRAICLMALSYDYLLKENWEVAKIFNSFLLKDVKMPMIPRTYAQLNCWLCEKRMNGIDKIKNELENADFSDKNFVTQMALASLKEEPDKFFELLPKAIDSEELDIEDLLKFPIFEEMRKMKKYKEFCLKNPKVSKYIKNKNH